MTVEKEVNMFYFENKWRVILFAKGCFLRQYGDKKKYRGGRCDIKSVSFGLQQEPRLEKCEKGRSRLII